MSQQITTIANAPSANGGDNRLDGNRSQSTLVSAFPNSPILGQNATYQVVLSSDGKYTHYEKLLINEFKATDREQARVHWGFTDVQDVTLGYELAPDLYDVENSRLHYGFTPNLLPPTTFSATADNPVFVAPPTALQEGRQLPLQPNQTSTHNRETKPEMIPVDSAGGTEFTAETIPVAQPDPPPAANNQ